MKLLLNIRNSKEKRLLLINFFNYGLFQASNYIIPLITIPYIIRIVGLEKFGIISLALGISNYIRVAVDYGWSILGVQYIAKAQKNSKKKSEIVSTIFFIQLILTIIGFILLIVVSNYFVVELKEWIVYIAAYGLVPGYMMIAAWFFVGMEDVKYLNIINFAGRLMYLILVFSLLKSESQYYLVPLFNSFSLIIAGLISLVLILKKFQINVFLPRVNIIKKYLVEGWPIFISYFATNLYRNTNILILALFASKEIVGIFAAAEKIIKVIQGIFTPITQTLYPYISRITIEHKSKVNNIIKKTVFIMSILTGFMVALIIILADWIIVIVLNSPSELGADLLKIGSSVIFFGVLNFIIGIIYMTNYGMKKQFSNAVILTGIINVIYCYIMSSYFLAIGAMISFVFAEFILLLLLLNYIRTNNRLRIYNIYNEKTL